MKFYALFLAALLAVGSMNGMEESRDVNALEQLFDAIEENDIEAVKALITDINTCWVINQKNNGRTPLEQALNNNEPSWNIAVELVKNGAHFDYLSNYPPLCKAILYEKIDLTLLLLEKGAAYKTPQVRQLLQTVRSPFAFQLIDWALEKNNQELIKELGQLNLVNRRDNPGNTPLHLVAQLPDKNKRSANARSLLVAGANPNIANKAGLTPLHIAVNQDDEHLFALLVLSGADVAAPFPAPLQNSNPLLDVMLHPLEPKKQRMFNVAKTVLAMRNPESLI